MLYENRVPDKELTAKVTQRLSRCGLGSHSVVHATIRNGTVTITGTVDYEYQRKPLVRSLNGVPGVRLVIDQLKVKPPAHWTAEHSEHSAPL